jgi:hypothetical protein
MIILPYRQFYYTKGSMVVNTWYDNLTIMGEIGRYCSSTGKLTLSGI